MERDVSETDHGFTIKRDHPGQQSKESPGSRGPHPLPTSLLPVVPFDIRLLPSQLRPWVADACERLQCPGDYIAVSAMAAAGGVIGRKVVVRPHLKDDWAVIANQWAMCVGRPGVMKSPAMEEALRPIKQLSAIAEQQFNAAQARYEVDAAAAKIRRDANVRVAAEIVRKDRTADISSLLEEVSEVEPVRRRYVANDTTVESLGVILQQNPNGLLIFRDELVSLLDTLDQEDHVSQRGFYLTGWNGNSPYIFDRIGRGLHLSIEAVCLSILGSTQPGRISSYLSRAMRGGRFDDGLVQRFGLLVWPDVSREWNHVDRQPDRNARDAAHAVFRRLDQLDWRAIRAQRDRGANGDEEGLPYLRLTIDAYDLFVAWRIELERRLRLGELHPALESHLAKYRKLIPSLALICHLIDENGGPLGSAAMERGIGWAAYLESHARRAYGSVTAAEADTARVILACIESGHLRSEFTARDVWRPSWSRLTDRTAVQAGLDMLVDYEWLTCRRLETGGRPSMVYSFTPWWT
jgi:putative DNA primase/helicase